MGSEIDDESDCEVDRERLNERLFVWEAEVDFENETEAEEDLEDVSDCDCEEDFDGDAVSDKLDV